MSKFVNWMIDHLSSRDIIDLYFVQSDLKNLSLTPGERAEMAAYDQLAQETASKAGNSKIPLGKQVR